MSAPEFPDFYPVPTCTRAHTRNGRIGENSGKSGRANNERFG